MAEVHEHDVNVPDRIDGSWRPRPAARLASLELDGELVLLDPRTDGLHHLDRLATIIWKVLDGQGSVDELVDDLADAFDARVDVVRTDLEELLVKLRAAGLLDGWEPPSYLLVAAKEAVPENADSEGIWRPEYLVDPPAP